MFNSIPELLRKNSVENLVKTNTFRRCWSTWQPQIIRQLGIGYTEDNILNLGNHLSAIFTSTGGTGRGQGELSASGTAWESLVCWYLNLCLAGSRTVAIRKMSLVPMPIRDSITVNYSNLACNTESDITVIVFPDLPEYNNAINLINVTDSNGRRIPPLYKNKLNVELLDHLVRRDFRQLQVGIIQCKTNWNDNAQIPMLWDMIYSAGGFRKRNLSIGRNGFTIQDITFSYSFVTVPSNRKANYDANSLAVKRVTNLSGGNYWGKPTQRGVAASIAEIFKNYREGARVNLRTDLHQALSHFGSGNALAYFGL